MTCVSYLLGSDHVEPLAEKDIEEPRSKSAYTHRFKRLRTPAKCRQCDTYVYFNGYECDVVSDDVRGVVCGGCGLGVYGRVWFGAYQVWYGEGVVYRMLLSMLTVELYVQTVL